jgi:hypothetical protein
MSQAPSCIRGVIALEVSSSIFVTDRGIDLVQVAGVPIPIFLGLKAVQSQLDQIKAHTQPSTNISGRDVVSAMQRLR